MISTVLSMELFPNTKVHITKIDVKNEDNRCFEWVILSAIYPVNHGWHPDRTADYRNHLGKLNFDVIDFPIKAADIGRFRRQNINISVNVFG